MSSLWLMTSSRKVRAIKRACMFSWVNLVQRNTGIWLRPVHALTCRNKWACMSSWVHFVQRNIGNWLRPVHVLTCQNKCSSLTCVLFSLQQHTTIDCKCNVRTNCLSKAFRSVHDPGFKPLGLQDPLKKLGSSPVRIQIPIVKPLCSWYHKNFWTPLVRELA